MNEKWKSLLLSQSAVVDDATGTTRFRDVREEINLTVNQTVLVDLSYWTLLSAHGEDTTTFLQGQLSNDIRLVTDTRSQLSAYNTPKGRMLVLFRIVKRADRLLLSLPTALAADTLKRLRLYVLRSKVIIADASDTLAHFGVAGKAAKERILGLVGSVPEDAEAVLTYNDITVISLPGPVPRFEVIAPIDVAVDLWKKFSADLVCVGTHAWRWFDIHAGIPSVQPGTTEEFVPQMANLELVGGVNFKKGCYPGQEIVARMQYLGNLKQRMYRAHVETQNPIQPGDKLYSPAFGESAAGHVVDAEPALQSGYDVLAVAQVSAVQANALHLASLIGDPLRLETLPYSVTLPESKSRA